MAITLTPEQERLVEQAVQTGAYPTACDVIDCALESLRSQDEWMAENSEAIRAKIERGFAQLDLGEGIPEEQLRERLTERKSAWLAEHPH